MTRGCPESTLGQPKKTVQQIEEDKGQRNWRIDFRQFLYVMGNTYQSPPSHLKNTFSRSAFAIRRDVIFLLFVPAFVVVACPHHTISGGESFQARSNPVKKSSTGWAPEMAYFSSKTKKGTPVQPKACARSLSARTAAAKSSLASI